MKRPLVIFSTILMTAWAFNGELVELECPDDCDCHYFRVNWVTDCSDSNLTEIPYDEISQNVYILDLNSNFIARITPFPPDIKMRRFQIADNLLTELRAESFGGLHYLLDADFSGNKIAKIDPDAFKDSAGLITLELQGNPLGPIEGPFLIISTLLYLDISNCGIAALSDEFFENITSLTTLDLSNNPLKSINGKVFAPLTSLESLKMNSCNMTYIDESAFASQSILQRLELTGNMLVEIEWPHVMQSLVRLEYLNLRGSHLKKLPDDVFNNTVYMRTLILAENHLENFDVASALGTKLHQLDTLDLSYCNLNRPLSEDAFAHATKLTNLLLSGNSLFSSSDLLVALAPLVKLQKLSLSNCGLSVLPDTFEKFKSLQELDISMNPLNDSFVKLLAPLENLEYLNMGYCNLSYMSPTTFSKMTSMKRLILSGNDLNSLEAGLFQNLTSLESLELNYCGLRRPLNATMFFNILTYTDLTELKLAGNPLRVSPTGPLLPKQLSRLQTLDLSNCNLTFLPPDAFYWTRNITSLILEGNHLTISDLISIELLPKLKILDLRNNNLSRLSPKDLGRNPNLEKLKLLGNPWVCNCSIAELWDWAVLEKGDVSILEGSTIIEEHVVAGKPKRKKLLTCNYNTDLPIVLNKTAAGRKPFIKPVRVLNAATRTWGKYVRESGCEQAEVKRLPRSSMEVLSYEEKLMALAKHGPNTWSTAAIQAGVIYCILMAIVIIVYYTMVKNRQPATLIDKNN